MKVTGATIEQMEKDRPRSRCRRWRLWATTECGRKSRRFRGTYTDAQNALKAFVAELSEQIPNNDTFAAYAASWALWRDKSGTLSAGTVENDRRDIRALCRTSLADMRMDAITPQDCREALLWLKSHPTRGDGELSGTTMNKLHIKLGSILQTACDDGLIAKNPMAKIKPPKIDTKEKEALSPDELMALVMRLDGLPLDGRTMALYLMAVLGLRRGEACGAYASDLSDGLLHVRRAVKERNGKVEEPKTQAGVRTLPVPPVLLSKLDEWHQVRRAMGWESSLTLCCNTQGGILRPQLLQRWWTGDSAHNGVRDALGCPGMTLHQLRHSNLSMMARRMSPFDLQHYAGWSSIEPARVYIHDDLEATKSAVAGAWRMIGRTKNAPPNEKGQSVTP